MTHVLEQLASLGFPSSTMEIAYSFPPTICSTIANVFSWIIGNTSIASILDVEPDMNSLKLKSFSMNI